MGASRNVVIIGAGALGLGFLGPELSAEARVWFLDVPAKAELLARLSTEQSYCLNLASVHMRPLQVANVCAVSPSLEEASIDCLSRADLVFTAVGSANVVRLGSLLVRAAERRRAASPLPVLCAENDRATVEMLRRTCGTGGKVVVAGTVMGRMCRWAAETSSDPLFGSSGPSVIAEDFFGIPYEHVAGMPTLEFSCLQPRDTRRFELEKDIKLFAHNCVHGLWACAGALRGLDQIMQAGAEPSVLDRTERMLHGELMPALRSYFGELFDANEFRNYSAHLIRRLLSPTLADTVKRGIRGAADKLLPEERWIAAVRFIRGQGLCADAYLETIAEIMKISGLLRRASLGNLLATHCGLTSEEIEHFGGTLEQSLQKAGPT
jgi:mannitol-1-phosphate/altronate dehydrogenase